MADTKWSQFPSATPVNADEVVGLHSGGNARFSIANIVAAVRNGLASIFVPLTRTINGKGLSADISLDSSDIEYDNTQSGLTASDVQEAIDELAQGGGGTTVIANPSGAATDTLTKLQVNNTIYSVSGGGGGGTAASVTYDNTNSGLTATNVQAAIDEVVDDLDDKFDVDQVADPEGATASRNYIVGETFTRGGKLHVVTVSTAAGNALVDGTNCKAIKLSEGFVGTYAQPISNTNLNTMLVSGLFISVTGNSSTPTSTYTSEYTPFMVIGNGSVAAQIFVLRTGAIRSRMYISGSWTGWQS